MGDFAKNMNTCAHESFGLGGPGGKCMERLTGASDSCGLCMGDLIHCGTACATQCCLGFCPTSADCQSCNKAKCNPAFAQCAGEEPPTPTTRRCSQWNAS